MEYIEQTPGTCGGKPRIAGSRIRVQDVAILHEDEGLTPCEIQEYYPHLRLSEVYAALAYYFDHREEIRKDIADADAFVERLKRQHPENCYENIFPNDQ